MFTIKLRKADSSLTYKEQLIAKYLINYRQYDASLLTSSLLAEQLNVSQATVIRFSQKLGYQSFKEMVMDIEESSALNIEGNVSPDDSGFSIMEKLKALYTSSIDEVGKLNTPEVIGAAAEALSKSRTVFCYGIRTSACIAFIVRNRLVSIGINAEGTEDEFLALSATKNLGSSDAVFIVSVSGETPEAVKLAKLAHSNGCKVISMTANHQNTIRELSDIPLIVPESAMFTDVFSLNNKCPQIFLIDSLFLSILKNDTLGYQTSIKEMNALIEDEPGQSKYELYSL